MFAILSAVDVAALAPPDDTLAALQPVPLTDGRYALPLAILDDPAHTKNHHAIAALPRDPHPPFAPPPPPPVDLFA
jgi:hypothetical protein